jgi:hypothetical protein
MNIPNNFKEWQEINKLSPEDEIIYEKYKNKITKFRSIFIFLFKTSMFGSMVYSIITLNSSLLTMCVPAFSLIFLGIIFYYIFKKYDKRYRIINISDEEYYKYLKSIEEEEDDYYYYCRRIIKDENNEHKKTP